MLAGGGRTLGLLIHWGEHAERKDRKSVAAVHNFRMLMEAGGPKRLFKKLAALGLRGGED